MCRLSAPDRMLWLQLRQGQCEVVTDRRKTHANEASLDKGMPHRGAAAPPTGALARRSHMPLPLRHLSVLRPVLLSEPMPEPAYYVRCSGKQVFHSKLVEGKEFWLSVPICNAYGLMQT